MNCRKFWLGSSDTSRGKVTLILTGNRIVLLEEEPMKRCKRGGIKQGKQPSLLILKINLRSLQLTQWQMVQLTLTIHSQRIPLTSNTYVFLF
jgi:hypothetical protein